MPYFYTFWINGSFCSPLLFYFLKNVNYLFQSCMTRCTINWEYSFLNMQTTYSWYTLYSFTHNIMYVVKLSLQCIMYILSYILWGHMETKRGCWSDRILVGDKLSHSPKVPLIKSRSELFLWNKIGNSIRLAGFLNSS